MPTQHSLKKHRELNMHVCLAPLPDVMKDKRQHETSSCRPFIPDSFMYLELKLGLVP
jgi:hypothetical protein